MHVSVTSVCVCTHAATGPHLSCLLWETGRVLCVGTEL